VVTLGEVMASNGIDGPVPEGVALHLAPPLLRRLWAGSVSAMTTPHAVWAAPEAMARIEAGRGAALLRHELTHVAQWRRHGTIGFAGRYLGHYLLVRATEFPHAVAYRAIPFEQEAAEAARTAS
jgi:hypothetical protein